MEVNNYEVNTYYDGKNIIDNVDENSIAEELGIESGDILVSINNNKITDIIDYKYLITDDFITLTIQKKDGELWDIEIEKDFYEDIGITFTNPLIDKAKNCKNKCIFCFIDQLPKGMRKTLYFKDDDSRLSFLQGNFITLTNLSDEEIDRIIRYRLSPINVSVHTTDPELRVKMLNNKNAGKVYDILKRFSDAGIEMNCQIVLIPGINDGDNLNKTLKDLSYLYPNISSVAVVPVGLTKYREGLSQLSTYDYETANELIEFIHNKEREYLKDIGTRFVFASDEFYILAKKPVLEYEDYEGFPQYENGVGLIRSFYCEVQEALLDIKENLVLDRSFTIATGTLSYDFIKEIASMVMAKIDGLNLNVVPIINEFFGEKITVSGLVTGGDLINQLKTCEIKDGLIIPSSMLKSGEKVFLDDITVANIENSLNTRIIISDIDGEKFVDIFKNEMRC
ncbi:DUF512 domain-containing protein [Proteiniborus sp. MB09-C3]|uniref:DUF512 domain-containing protein n=1 Tax=Proteiniborus sp. MB09-C3 TaxID=3050072 RepID=UPI0025562634|nr:DUF512 domain-containing protein [Proteiniborus sp. MB09-C3]WIV10778.1 DUF512 domain-containing protein [Proteiniborus sp. MB09-C3]